MNIVRSFCDSRGTLLVLVFYVSCIFDVGVCVCENKNKESPGYASATERRRRNDAISSWREGSSLPRDRQNHRRPRRRCGGQQSSSMIRRRSARLVCKGHVVATRGDPGCCRLHPCAFQETVEAHFRRNVRQIGSCYRIVDSNWIRSQGELRMRRIGLVDHGLLRRQSEMDSEFMIHG